jgi:hypothetical protein
MRMKTRRRSSPVQRKLLDEVDEKEPESAE